MNLKDNLNLKDSDTNLLIKRLIQELGHSDRNLFDSLSDHEKSLALKILSELKDEGSSDLLGKIWEIDYLRKPISLREFVEDEYYCGKYIKDTLYDTWKEELDYVMTNDIIEWILAGAIGIGKTTVGIVAQLYKLYLLTCMRDPCNFYHANSLVFSLFSVSLSLATTVEYNMITTRLKESEYFRSVSGVSERDMENSRKFSSEILNFPNNIKFVFGSRAVHGLGMDVFCLDWNTKVRGLAGHLTSLREALEMGPGREFSLYAWDVELQKPVIGWAYAVDAGKKQVREVRLSNGRVVAATDEHRWLLPSGEYKMTSELSVGEELRSLDRSKSDGYNLNPDLYPNQEQYKVKSISADTYETRCCDLVVRTNRRETDNNFLLDSGVFVHNSGLMDEVAFSNSSESKQVVELYNGIKRRLESRFLDEKGKLPGILCVISSANYEGDWLDAHIKKSRDKSLTHISNLALYDVKRYKGEKFRVLVGDKLHSSKLIDSVASGNTVTGESPPKGASIIEVPNVFYDRYADDLEGSLKDISGIAIYSTSLLLPQREKIYSCIDESRKHPFTVDSPVIDIDDEDVTLESLFNFDSIFEEVDPYKRINRCKVNPGAPRFVSVDLALKQDCVGIAVCHLHSLVELKRSDGEGNESVTHAPVVYYDLMLRVVPPRGSEIDISKIRSFIFYLRDKSLPIDTITFDQYQSADSLQIFSKAGLTTKRYSVDRRPSDAYLSLKSAILESRINIYSYGPFLDEISTVQYSRDQMKVDHPPTGSKDVSDAVAAAYWTCTTSQYTLDRLSEASMTTSGLNKVDDKAVESGELSKKSWVYGDYEDADMITDIWDEEDRW